MWNYYTDETNSGVVENVSYSIRGSKYFDCKTSITGRLEGNNTGKEVLKISLIKYEINLVLSWSENRVITSKATRNSDPDADPAVAEIDNPINATFKIRDTNLYAPAVTLSTEDYNKLSEQLKAEFKRTIKWN